MITALITCCKRLHNVERIWQALRSQSQPCDDVWLFYNGKDDLAPGDLPPFGRTIRSTDASDHYTRYAVGLAAPTEWVFIIDDDCVPGPRWVENCMETARRLGDGIFAPAGGRIHRPDFASAPYEAEGDVRLMTHPRRSRPIEVDVPFHSFLLKRRHLAAMFHHPLGVGLRGGEQVPITGQEDVLLACRAWLHHRVRVFLPAVPEPALAGTDEEVNERIHATWFQRPLFGENRLAALRYEAALGWRPWISRGAPWRRRRRRRRLAEAVRSRA